MLTKDKGSGSVPASALKAGAAPAGPVAGAGMRTMPAPKLAAQMAAGADLFAGLPAPEGKLEEVKQEPEVKKEVKQEPVDSDMFKDAINGVIDLAQEVPTAEPFPPIPPSGSDAVPSASYLFGGLPVLQDVAAPPEPAGEVAMEGITE